MKKLPWFLAALVSAISFFILCFIFFLYVKFVLHCKSAQCFYINTYSYSTYLWIFLFLISFLMCMYISKNKRILALLLFITLILGEWSLLNIFVNAMFPLPIDTLEFF